MAAEVKAEAEVSFKVVLLSASQEAQEVHRYM